MMARDLTPELIDELRKVARKHGGPAKFARRHGIPLSTVYRWINHRITGIERARAVSRTIRSAQRDADARVARLKEEMPDDSRDLTSRMMGDPPFSRSALARYREAAG